MTIKIKATKKIATESLDHTDPRGAINDNSTNPSFINELQNYYNDRGINFMDVGCAGGQFVIDMSNKMRSCSSYYYISHIFSFL